MGNETLGKEAGVLSDQLQCCVLCAFLCAHFTKWYMNDDIYCQDNCVNIIYKSLQYSPLFRTSHIICKPHYRLPFIPARELRVYL